MKKAAQSVAASMRTKTTSGDRTSALDCSNHDVQRKGDKGRKGKECSLVSRCKEKFRRGILGESFFQKV